MRLRWTGVLAVMALVVVSCGGGTPEASGPGEGIQVHGDWVIDVYNADGSLDHHVEFSNDLTPFGANQLAELVSGSAAVGLWAIFLQGASGAPEPCPSNTTWSGTCVVPAEATWTSGTASFSLTGSTAVEADAQIVAVETRVGSCPADVAPANCPLSGAINAPYNFTYRSLAAADLVDVLAGQLVEVQVEISFASG